ncbi:phosphoenolpyruvate carboxykinase [Zavarzinia sp. CC-PAN008]|uniref:phosphoenolpyruvate carboxykinase n=1 Tax=Zavarzinia sp. CC-PAN008 TaxID=3243332 RepID=UPI003F748990
MLQSGPTISHVGLDAQGLRNLRHAYWNLEVPALYEEAIRRGEGVMADGGPFVVRTGQHTGRSANDKFIVRDPSYENDIWWGKSNAPIERGHFEQIKRKVLAYYQGRDAFVQDLYGGADPTYRLPVRVVTESAWHSLFIRNLLIVPPAADRAAFVPQFTIIQAPGFLADPAQDGSRSEVVIAVDFAEKLVIIAGTSYAGEIKKSVFTILNYLLPAQGVMPMHCSVNVGARGDSAVFFGLSGTGKTTLSADPDRTLVGDDEHGWTDHGVFNFEGGCYAKMIRLSAKAEPEIYAATRRFGTVLENVVIDENSRVVDLDDARYAENTRGAYPLSFIPNASTTGLAGNPENVIMLTADAFGVLPPIARLSPEQAMYHFLSGYTAKVAGTEKGVGTEPQATFSTCFGAPFMPRHPTVYGNLLKEKIARHGVKCWLVNTGWTGGVFGVGHRMPIAVTRALLKAALDGSLANAPTRIDPNFGFQVPTAVPGVPTDVLDPRSTWADKAAYDAKARDLVGLFIKNFAQFEAHVDEGIRNAAPKAA